MKTKDFKSHPSRVNDTVYHYAEGKGKIIDGYDTVVKSILAEAERIVNGERQADYNNPVANFTKISNIASAIIGKEVSPRDCCIVMIAVKLAREAYKHKRDNLVDLAGYTEILNRIQDEKGNEG